MLAWGTVLSRPISGSLTSFAVTGSVRGPGRDGRRARSRDSVNERGVYKVSLQTSSQRPSSCSKEGLWAW
jgi:hypothetical protein